MSSTLSTVNTNVKNLMNSGNSVVKSVQRGVFNSRNSNTVTISSVNVNKSIVVCTGGIGMYAYYSSGNYSYNYASSSACQLSNSTTITFSPVSQMGSAVQPGNIPIYWQVIEFY